MVDARTIFKKRESTREYLEDQITKGELDFLIESGLSASTAMDRQSWHFTVVQDKEFLKEISNSVAQVLIDSEVPSLIERATDEKFHSFYHAPTVIFISREANRYSFADCANAAQTICLAATAIELGSCYIGSFVQAFNSEKGKYLLKRFNLPAGYKPTFAVAIGYPKNKLTESIKEREYKVDFIR